MFIAVFLYFEYGVLVHTIVCIGSRQSSGTFRILDTKMQSHTECHRRKLDLGQQPKPETGRKYALGCSRAKDDGTVSMVFGSGQSSILGGYPGVAKNISP
jgi:hypothetical protein